MALIAFVEAEDEQILHSERSWLVKVQLLLVRLIILQRQYRFIDSTHIVRTITVDVCAHEQASESNLKRENLSWKMEMFVFFSTASYHEALQNTNHQTITTCCSAHHIVEINRNVFARLIQFIEMSFIYSLNTTLFFFIHNFILQSRKLFDVFTHNPSPCCAFT